VRRRRSPAADPENVYDKEVYNGDVGYIDNVDPDTGRTLRQLRRPTRHLLRRTRHAGAGLHDRQSQGSEYPAVVIPIVTQHYAMPQRNLLYTGVTRGKRLVVLVGQKKAVAIAVRNVSGRRRWSKLRSKRSAI